MSFVTQKMGLRVWDQLSDPYNHSQMADNMAKIDLHDHTPGRGIPIPTEGISDGAITNAKLAQTNLIGTSQLTDGSVTTDKLADAARLGLSGLSVVRRGYSSVPGNETRTNTAYGLMPTPDQVANVSIPANSYVAVFYQAIWQESVAGAARAAIFIGANQVQIQQNDVGPAVQAAATNSGVAAKDLPLFSFNGGLASQASGSGGAAEVTTGQIFGAVDRSSQALAVEVGTVITLPAGSIAGGPCFIFGVTPGTYTVSVQFKSSSGNVQAKNRRLIVETWSA
jgi:hypothetical protein